MNGSDRPAWRLSVAAAAVCGTVLVTGTPARARPGAPYLALGDQIVAVVQDNFVDAAQARSWARTHRGYGARLPEWAAFTARTHEILAELATSHTAFYPRDGAEHPALSAIFAEGLKTQPTHTSLGVDLARTADGLFVRRVFPEGPGETAGLLRGDRILAVDGKPPDPSRPLVEKADREVRLTVQRAAGAPALELRAVPILVNPKQEWLAMQRAGSKIVERDGERIGYHPMFSCAGAEHEAALRESLTSNLASAAALVLDFRDGWGGCLATLVDLFSPVAPTVIKLGRGGKRSTSSASWQRPVVLLINGGSRSGKEIVAFVLKKHRLAVLVGERTAGAVVTGKVFPLSDGSLLYLAVAHVLVDDQRLEGVGVAPDVEVRDTLPYAQGKDPQFERALGVAVDEIRKRKARNQARP